MKKFLSLILAIALTAAVTIGTAIPIAACHDYDNDNTCDTTSICDNLPTDKITAYFEKNSPESTFLITINDDNWIDNPASYDGWCVDTVRQVLAGNSYTVKAYCSYGTIPAGLVDKPENLDAVNWLLNQNPIGSDSGVDGVYTFGDMQIALWTLLCNNVPAEYVSDSYFQPTSSTRVDTLVSKALAEGEGFKPNAGQKLVVLLGIVDDADNFTGQTTIITIEIPGDCCWDRSCKDKYDYDGRSCNDRWSSDGRSCDGNDRSYDGRSCDDDGRSCDSDRRSYGDRSSCRR